MQIWHSWRHLSQYKAKAFFVKRTNLQKIRNNNARVLYNSLTSTKSWLSLKKRANSTRKDLLRHRLASSFLQNFIVLNSPNLRDHFERINTLRKHSTNTLYPREIVATLYLALNLLKAAC